MALAANGQARFESKNPLSKSDASRLVQKMRSQMTGKTFVVSPLPEQPQSWQEQLVFGAMARPSFLRSRNAPMTYFSGKTARECGGGRIDGELLIDYAWNEIEGRWVTSGVRAGPPYESDVDEYADAFNASYAEGELTMFLSKQAYRLIAPYVDKDVVVNPQFFPPAPKQIQELWIDADRMLPVQWDILDEW